MNRFFLDLLSFASIRKKERSFSAALGAGRDEVINRYCHPGYRAGHLVDAVIAQVSGFEGHKLARPREKGLSRVAVTVAQLQGSPPFFTPFRIKELDQVDGSTFARNARMKVVIEMSRQPSARIDHVKAGSMASRIRVDFIAEESGPEFSEGLRFEQADDASPRLDHASRRPFFRFAVVVVEGFPDGIVWGGEIGKGHDG